MQTFCYGCGKESTVEYCADCRTKRIAALKEACREWDSLIAHANDPAAARRHKEETEAEIARLEKESA